MSKDVCIRRVFPDCHAMEAPKRTKESGGCTVNTAQIGHLVRAKEKKRGRRI